MFSFMKKKPTPQRGTYYIEKVPKSVCDGEIRYGWSARFYAGEWIHYYARNAGSGHYWDGWERSPVTNDQRCLVKSFIGYYGDWTEATDDEIVERLTKAMRKHLAWLDNEESDATLLREAKRVRLAGGNLYGS